MKTDTTKKLEQLLYHKFNPRKDFFVFECTLGWYGNEIVDCILYNTAREVFCYEIKQSYADFHSKSRVSFVGNKNYYVMPLELYEKVKEEIPKEIGVYVACKREIVEKKTVLGNEYYEKYLPGFDELVCVKNAQNRLLRADKEVILSSMLRCACRDRMRETGIFSYCFEDIKDEPEHLFSKIDDEMLY